MSDSNERIAEQVGRNAEAVSRNAAAVESNAREVKHSAAAVERSAVAQEGSADRRTELAADRTILAAERTYAAWVRTGLAALASGVGARALLTKVAPVWTAASAGVLLTAFAAFCFVAGVWRELRPGAPPPEPDTARLPRAVLILVNGVLTLVALVALVGVALGHG